MTGNDDAVDAGGGLSHPTRRVILTTLAHESRPLSATAIARLRGIERTRYLYRHFEYLSTQGLIEVAHTEQRTTIERFWALTARGRAVAHRLTGLAD